MLDLYLSTISNRMNEVMKVLTIIATIFIPITFIGRFARWAFKQFGGRIIRIAPIFRKSTRQARTEITIDNPRLRLKPGMFIRATVEITRVPDATIVPEQALTRRNDNDGVFVVSANGRSAIWREVTIGIQENGRVQVSGEGLSGQVVTLGQQLLDDGSPISFAGAKEGQIADTDQGATQ